jgi:hypothetical protein
MPGGVVHVSAYGGGEADQCLVGSWFVAGFDEHAVIHCYDVAGAPTDRRFMASFTSVASDPGYDYGYLRADQPTSASYTPSLAYQYTTAGSAFPNLITRSGVGQYQVTMTGLETPLENVMVSALGTTGKGPARCRVVSSSGQTAHVACSVGVNPIDSMFTLTYTGSGNLLGAPDSVPGDPFPNHLPSAYAKVSGGGSSVPSASRRFSTSNDFPWSQSYDPSTGQTTVYLPTKADGGDAQVVPYGTGTAAACDAANVSDTSGGSENVVVVQCWDALGHVTPGEFNLFFMGQPEA